jgi:hypothetical protein
VPNDGWLRGQSYSKLRDKGLETLRSYADLLITEDTELLATEYGFSVPIDGTWDEDLGEPHRLAGSVDRLGARHWRRQLFVALDDYKSGAEYIYLRQNLQGTAYCYASTKREFWVGDQGEDGFGEARGDQLFQRFDGLSRKFTWINLRSVKFEDGGWRGPQDYIRFRVIVEQFVSLVKADIYPLSVSGSVCRSDPRGDPRSGADRDETVNDKGVDQVRLERVDLLHALCGLDAADDPGACVGGARTPPIALAVTYHEVIAESPIVELQHVHGGGLRLPDADSHVLAHVTDADPQAGGDRLRNLEVFPDSRADAQAAALVEMAVRCEVAGEPAVEVGGCLVHVWDGFEEARQTVDHDCGESSECGSCGLLAAGEVVREFAFVAVQSEFARSSA